MIELKRELEALAEQWHLQTASGMTTNMEHAAQLRQTLERYKLRQQKEAIERAKVSYFRALECDVPEGVLIESMREAAAAHKTLPLLATARHRINLTT